MHECYMDFMQKMHEKNAFFKDKKLVVPVDGMTATFILLIKALHYVTTVQQLYKFRGSYILNVHDNISYILPIEYRRALFFRGP